MATKHIRLLLPNDLRLLCRKAGELMVEDLKNPQTFGDVLSASISTHGAQLNPFLQADARAAEAIFCLWSGCCDPIPVINRRHADHGWDMMWHSVRIDVKHTQHPRGHLTWPVGKTKIIDQKDFDILVLVVGASQTFELCGWVTKTHFLKNYQIAGNGHFLTPGTWFMPQEQLWEIDTLPESIEWMADNDEAIVLRA